ncbi:MAG: hypothetical protein P8N11_01550 [Gammaproteobacteria bacterium]|jgi:hypothetical protein|nr:hypothetical protein [Gammaproteobacteria bacterium]
MSKLESELILCEYAIYALFFEPELTKLAIDAIIKQFEVEVTIIAVNAIFEQ